MWIRPWVRFTQWQKKLGVTSAVSLLIKKLTKTQVFLAETNLHLHVHHLELQSKLLVHIHLIFILMVWLTEGGLCWWDCDFRLCRRGVRVQDWGGCGGVRGYVRSEMRKVRSHRQGVRCWCIRCGAAGRWRLVTQDQLHQLLLRNRKLVLLGGAEVPQVCLLHKVSYSATSPSLCTGAWRPRAGVGSPWAPSLSTS